MSPAASEIQHAALWLIGPDMPGLLNHGARFVADHGGSIDKDIADKFGEKAVVFMSLTASPKDIREMERDKEALREATRCAVVFQPMSQPPIPPGFREELHGFDVITDDAVGVVAALTKLVADFGMMVVGHTGERRVIPGPRREVKGGQKFVVLLPHEFDLGAFSYRLGQLVKEYNGHIQTPLRPVPGLLWWW
jgi:glycine cleavage system regulatory protein